MKKILFIAVLTAAKIFAFQPVDINQASLEQLALLPGIGLGLAKDIVEYRLKHGAFVKKEQLLAIKGLSEKKFVALKEHINVGKSPMNKVKKTAPHLTKIEIKPPPDLAELEALVLKSQGLNQDFDHSLANRVRNAAYLPKLSASYDVDSDQALADKKANNNADSWLKRQGRAHSIGVRAVFDLDKLIFNHEELEVARLHLKRLEVREEVLKKMHEHYFAYARLYESAKNPMEEEVMKNFAMEMTELSGKLNAMSNGAFSRLQGEL